MLIINMMKIVDADNILVMKLDDFRTTKLHFF